MKKIIKYSFVALLLMSVFGCSTKNPFTDKLIMQIMGAGLKLKVTEDCGNNESSLFTIEEIYGFADDYTLSVINGSPDSIIDTCDNLPEKTKCNLVEIDGVTGAEVIDNDAIFLQFKKDGIGYILSMMPTENSSLKDSDDFIKLYEAIRDSISFLNEEDLEKIEQQQFSNFCSAFYEVLDNADIKKTDANTSDMIEILKSTFPTTFNTDSFDALDTYNMIPYIYFHYLFELNTDEYWIGEFGMRGLYDLYNGNSQSAKANFDNARIYAKQAGIDLSTDISTSGIKEGQYKVGNDIDAGQYVLFATDGSGYYSKTKDANGDEIINNENFDYNWFISIEDGQYLELSRCYAVPLDEDVEIDTTKADLLRVGIDIPAGEYKLATNSDYHGYYAIYSDIVNYDIVSNNNFDGQQYVSVSDGQYLHLSRCVIEK